MGNRPTDWNAIGLSTDPTPGDPVRLRALVTSMDSLGRVAREIDEALNSVLDKTGTGAFVGQTADALRDKISGPLREFVQSIADAFENAAKSMRAYADVMETQQRVADAALTNGRGLAPEDPQRAEYGTTARNAGSAQRTQAEATAKVVNSAATGIKQPVTDCDLFWEAFNWLAIILILPALLLGGPLALLAIGINLVLFVKTAVDVANGKAGLLDLFLAGLGMIAPTTKGLNLLKLFKDGAKFIWDKGLKAFAQGAWGGLKGAFGGGAFRSFAFIPGLKDFARLAGGWVKSGALWVGAATLKLPSWVASAIGKGGLAVVNGFKAMPALFRGLPGMIKGAAGSTWKFLKTELGGTKWLRLILPVDAAEISRFGLNRALRIGFYERGVLGKFRYASPLLSAGGRGLSQIPTPPPLHGVGALPEMSLDKLAQIRAGDWSGFGANELRLNSLDLPTNLTVTSPGGLHIPTSFGEVMQFAPDAVRRMDALLDIGARDLKMVQIGDWAKLPTPAGSTRLELNAVNSIGQLTPTTGAAAAVHALPTPSALPSVTHTPSLTSLSALDLVQSGAAHRPNMPSPATGNIPGGGTGIGHLITSTPTPHAPTAPSLHASGLNHGLPAPSLPASGLNAHGLTDPGLTGHGTPGPHVELRPTEFGSSANLSAPSPTALASGPPPTALVPDHAGNALNLLDHGPSTPLRLDSPANAGALPPAPPPHGPGGG
ncbi:putative T7SS-secreted protein, partial [Embleya sp. NPDC005575]|uniref:putative T7SS-secreted protein n=1 Tax=Embleya sp. NPDC005575 TaxID=3156892 RepID=UPI0033B77CE1